MYLQIKSHIWKLTCIVMVNMPRSSSLEVFFLLFFGVGALDKRAGVVCKCWFFKMLWSCAASLRIPRDRLSSFATEAWMSSPPAHHENPYQNHSVVSKEHNGFLRNVVLVLFWCYDLRKIHLFYVLGSILFWSCFDVCLISRFEKKAFPCQSMFKNVNSI